jgi:NAD(P)H-hydrate repair Nnr-like enzyme with NAD(P)H-hydrate dehydratase domain
MGRCHDRNSSTPERNRTIDAAALRCGLGVSTVEAPEARCRRLHLVSQPNLMESDMDETLELELVDLGDAKVVTMGPPDPIANEDNPDLQQRVEP